MDRTRFTLDEMDRLLILREVESKQITQGEAVDRLGLSERQMEKVVKLAQSVDAFLLIDEVYREEEIFGEGEPSLYGHYEKIIVNSSLSKAFGLPGLRLGWTIGPIDYIEQACIRRDYTTRVIKGDISSINFTHVF